MKLKTSLLFAVFVFLAHCPCHADEPTDIRTRCFSNIVEVANGVCIPACAGAGYNFLGQKGQWETIYREYVEPDGNRWPICDANVCHCSKVPTVDECLDLCPKSNRIFTGVFKDGACECRERKKTNVSVSCDFDMKDCYKKCEEKNLIDTGLPWRGKDDEGKCVAACQCQ